MTPAPARPHPNPCIQLSLPLSAGGEGGEQRSAVLNSHFLASPEEDAGGEEKNSKRQQLVSRHGARGNTGPNKPPPGSGVEAHSRTASGAKALTLTATSGAASTATAREGLAEGDLVKCMRESAAGSGHRPPSLSESDSDPEPEP